VKLLKLALRVSYEADRPLAFQSYRPDWPKLLTESVAVKRACIGILSGHAAQGRDCKKSGLAISRAGREMP